MIEKYESAEEAAYSRLLGYVKYMWDGYKISLHHQIIAKHLMAIERGDIKRLIIAMPPRSGKPNDINELLLMGDGTRKKLGDIELGDMVITHTGQAQKVLEIFEHFQLETIKIVTNYGRESIAALDHPYLTPTGWKEAGDLQINDVLAIQHNPNIKACAIESDEEFAFTGYMIGDGSTSSNASFTNGDPALVGDFHKLCNTLQFPININRRVNNHWELFPTKCRPWLRKYKLWGCTSHTKRIPDFIYNGTDEQVAKFIAAYYDCDGSVFSKGGGRKIPTIELYSVNKELLIGVQHLLLRLSINTKIASKNGKDQHGNPHKSWRMSIYDHDSVAKFFHRIPLRGEKKDKLSKYNLSITKFGDYQYFSDPIVDIQKNGKRDCRCLTVENDHTYTVQDIVVHNTMLVSEYFPAWYFGRNPDKQIIAATFSGDRANDIGRKVRNQMIDPVYKKIFPDCNVSPDSKSMSKITTLQNGICVTTGVHGTVVGRGAHLFLIDDPISGREKADSENERKKLVDWYRGVAHFRLMDHGAIILVMTRWHFDDLTGYLLRDDEERGRTGDSFEGWTVLNIPAICEDPEDDMLGRAKGETIWPDNPIFTLKNLADIKYAGKTREWNAQYMQRPLPDEGGMVHIDWFRRYDRSDLHEKKDIAEYAVAVAAGERVRAPKCIKKIVMSWDTAFKESEVNDPSACTIWAMVGKDYYLIYSYAMQLTYPFLKKKIVELHDKYNATIPGYCPVLIEDKASGQSLIQDFKNDKYTKLPIVKMFGKKHKYSNKGKVVRFEQATDLIEAGRVFLPKKAAWLVDYETQICQFPYGVDDDLADSTSQFLIWAGQPRFQFNKMKNPFYK